MPSRRTYRSALAKPSAAVEETATAPVSRTLHLDIQTVRRFADTTSVDELIAKSVERRSKINPYKEHLHRRWNEGLAVVARLADEIAERGYRGSVQAVRRYLRSRDVDGDGDGVEFGAAFRVGVAVAVPRGGDRFRRSTR